MNNINKMIKEAGWPRIIIALFLLSMYVVSPFIGINLKAALGDTLVRFGMNAILVLSLVPMIQAGTGLNFGMPLGVEAGLFRSCYKYRVRIKRCYRSIWSNSFFSSICTFIWMALWSYSK